MIRVGESLCMATALWAQQGSTPTRPEQDHLRGPCLEKGLIKVSPQNKHFPECFSIHPFLKSTRNKKEGGGVLGAITSSALGHEINLLQGMTPPPPPSPFPIPCVFSLRSAMVSTFSAVPLPPSPPLSGAVAPSFSRALNVHETTFILICPEVQSSTEN